MSDEELELYIEHEWMIRVAIRKFNPRLDEDDYYGCVSDALIRAVQTYDNTRKGYKGRVAKFSTYFHSLANNAIVSELRSRGITRRSRIIDGERVTVYENDGAVLGFSDSIEKTYKREPTVDDIHVELELFDMSERERYIIDSKIYGLSNHEIAESLGISDRRVRDILRDIRGRLVSK